jgi:hypothetical protein
MDPRMALYYASALAGFVMVVGGIWLIYKEKIYIDRESQQPIEIQSPLGTFKSNYPALTLFALGFFPLVYPIYSVNNLTQYVRVETIPIKGPVDVSAYPAFVFAVREEATVRSRGEFRVQVPFRGGDLDDYNMILVVNNHVVGDARAVRSVNGKEIEVEFRPVIIEPEGGTSFETTTAGVPAAYR